VQLVGFYYKKFYNIINPIVVYNMFPPFLAIIRCNLQ